MCGNEPSMSDTGLRTLPLVRSSSKSNRLFQTSRLQKNNARCSYCSKRRSLDLPGILRTSIIRFMASRKKQKSRLKPYLARFIKSSLGRNEGHALVSFYRTFRRSLFSNESQKQLNKPVPLRIFIMNIYVETYGCTANKSDERLLVGLLQQNGHRIVSCLKDADVLVLLTCTVIGTTEQRMLSRLKVFHKTQKRIIVSGCMPTVQADLIISVAPTASFLPSQHIQYINDMIDGTMPLFVETKKTSLPKQYDGVIAPVLIAEGCRFSCSYCI